MMLNTYNMYQHSNNANNATTNTNSNNGALVNNFMDSSVVEDFSFINDHLLDSTLKEGIELEASKLDSLFRQLEQQTQSIEFDSSSSSFNTNPIMDSQNFLSNTSNLTNNNK